MPPSFQPPSRFRSPGPTQPPNGPGQSNTPERSAWRQFRRSLPLGNFFCAMFLISLVLFIGFFALSWVVVVRNTQSVGDRMLSENATGLLLFGHGFQLDLGAHTLSVLWTPVTCGGGSSGGVPAAPVGARIPKNCGPLDRAVDIYIDDLPKPIFTYTPHGHGGEVLNIWDRLGFTMDHRIDNDGGWDPTEQLTAPFDRYVLYAQGFAIDPMTNRSLPMGISIVADTLGDFVIFSHDAAATSEFTYDSGGGLVITEIEARALRAEIRRTVIAKTFAVSLCLINWLLAASSVYVTALVAYGGLEATSIVVALPFSALLTIPAIRSLRTTQSPPETSIGTAAFFLQLTTVALCSFILLRVLTRH